MRNTILCFKDVIYEYSSSWSDARLPWAVSVGIKYFIEMLRDSV